MRQDKQAATMGQPEPANRYTAFLLGLAPGQALDVPADFDLAALCNELRRLNRNGHRLTICERSSGFRVLIKGDAAAKLEDERREIEADRNARIERKMRGGDAKMARFLAVDVSPIRAALLTMKLDEVQVIVAGQDLKQWHRAARELEREPNPKLRREFGFQGARRVMRIE